jgi:hypothetical protein
VKSSSKVWAEIIGNRDDRDNEGNEELKMRNYRAWLLKELQRTAKP